MDNDLKTAMDESMIQEETVAQLTWEEIVDLFTRWETASLPVIAVALTLIWGVRHRSVIRRSLKQFRSQSDESDKLHLLNSYAFGVLIFILLILLVVVLLGIGKSGAALLSLKGENSEPLRWIGLTFVGLLTALAGILGAPLALIRINTTERQTRIKEREYTTSLLNQATEHLGASLVGTDPVKPNIPLRVGGLLALERIAQDNIEDYHVQIMDMICTYIRENSPYPESDTDAPPPEPQQGVWPSVRVDIRFAIDVLARRTPEQIKEESRREDYYLNLNRTKLTGVDFVRRNREANFANASFRDCSLIGAYFVGANLTKASLVGADLTEAYLMGVDLVGAHLMRAHLTGAHLTGANLTGANLSRAYLVGATMEHTNLTDARLISANLTNADFMDANLTRAYLMRTHLTGAYLTGVDLSGADLSGAHLQGAILDKADLTGAKVTKANFKDASMKGTRPKKSAILDHAQMSKPLPSQENSD